jgi:hypothetical protein
LVPFLFPEPARQTHAEKLLMLPSGRRVPPVETLGQQARVQALPLPLHPE